MNLTGHPYADEIRALKAEIARLSIQVEPGTPEYEEVLTEVVRLGSRVQRLYEEGRGADRMIDEKQLAELPPTGSCLICGHDKPFGAWKSDVGVCLECRDKARGYDGALRQAWQERDEHRERANSVQMAWDAHKAMDCAIRCTREIEQLLGTSSPVEAARQIREMVKECSDLHIENGRLEARCAAMRQALEAALEWMADIGADDEEFSHGDPVYGDVRTFMRAALSGDAGKALSEKMQALERVAEAAERMQKDAVPTMKDWHFGTVLWEDVEELRRALAALHKSVAARKEATP